MSGKNQHSTTLINAAREQVHGFHTAPLTGGWWKYPAQLVLQDVLTIHGRQFKAASLIVASPPCQEFSYMAMPWSLAKQKIRDYESGVLDVKQLTALFDACFRIQREASEAAGHHIPLVVENVRGAQRWVGRAKWHFGSFYLWGDVPALMPLTRKHVKVATMGAGWYPPDHPKHVPGLAFNGHAERAIRDGQKVPTDRICDCGHRESDHGINGFDVNLPCSRCSCINPVWKSRRTAVGAGSRFTTDCDGRKITGGSWFNIGSPGQKETGRNPVRQSGSTPARKAASAMIAKIPLTLSRHIAKAWYPETAHSFLKERL